MPTYEYACQSCGTHIEVFQRFSDESLTECGVCGGPLRKVFHPAGILFKGSGFYVTDSRSGASKTARSREGSKSAASGAEPSPAASSGESGSKPAAGDASSASTPAGSTGGAKEKSA
jgi:putative FmdB family regulatory protein